MTATETVTDDPALRALDELAQVLEQNAEEAKLLAARIRDLRKVRMDGSSWRDALAGESDPGTLQMVSRVLARLSMASGALRKSMVMALRAEGASIPSIARLFGVTHQRVSNLLRRTGG